MATEAGRAPATATTLAYTSSGPAGGPRVVAAHGFTQTGACLGPLVTDLATDHRVVLPDAPGHGGSVRHGGVDVVGAAALLATSVGAATYVGYSMGGRVCLQLAVDHPELVEGLVLVGATAGTVDVAERSRRRAADAELADRIETLGVEAFLEEWLAQPLFAGLPAWARFDEERRTNTAAGLAASLRHAGTGAMVPLWDRLGVLGDTGIPVRCVAGGLDRRFCEVAERLADAIGPPARAVVVPGVGHAAHLEAPAAVIDVVRSLP